MTVLRGSCLCGAVKFEVTGPLSMMLHCHCSRCRKEHGAPFATFAVAAADDLRWVSGQEDVVVGEAPPGGPRHFCGHCGSPAPSTQASMGLAFIPVGLLDGDPELRPQGHLFVGSKAKWHAITDTLPQHDKYPPEFGDAPSVPDRDPVKVAPGCAAGSCLCGKVTYEFSQPMMMFQCHCTRCRRARGAAHGANVFCKVEHFQWKSGQELVADYKLPEAKFYAVAFCRGCGGKLPRISTERGIVVIPASGLDTDPGIAPQAHIFVASKAPWHEITDSIPQFPEGPPSFGPPR